MTVCTKCAAKALQSCMKKVKGDPTRCVECAAPLEGQRENRRWRRSRLERYFCDACTERVLHRATGACYWCGRPLTPAAYGMMRRAQSDPGEGKAYRQRVQGRRVA